MLLWPYDELTLSKGPGPSEFLFQAPWLAVTLNVAEADRERVAALASKFQSQSLSPDDRFELSWLLEPLAALPLAYILPRPAEELAKGLDAHAIAGTAARDKLAGRDYTWDAETSLQFAQVAPGAHDPLTLLSIARRFHLIDLLQANPLRDAFARIESLKGDPDRHRRAMAIVIRQNHYVTTRCDECLAPAQSIGQSASAAVREFMEAERGHDRLLEKAVRSIASDPLSVPVVPAAVELMDFLKLSASANLLGFAMAVDAFERASYSEKDPLAAFLEKSGFDAAARQINVHKKINDSGEHENVSLELLERMGPASSDYALEALRLAEAVSQSIQAVSRDILAAVSAI